MQRTPVPAAPPVQTYGPEWADRQSLAQWAAGLEASLTSAPYLRADGSEDLAGLYDAMYERHLGRRPPFPARNSPRTIDLLARVSRACDAAGLDFAAFVAGNMAECAAWCFDPKYGSPRRPAGFWPNFLLGPKALERYNRFLRRNDRRFHHAREAASVSPAESELFDSLYEAELSVGAYFTGAAVSRNPVTWDQAVRASSPDRRWLALQPAPSQRCGPSGIWEYLCRTHSPERLRIAAILSTAKAAVTVADRYAPCLSARIGFGPDGFSWAGFADLMTDLFEPPKRTQPASKFCWKPGLDTATQGVV